MSRGNAADDALTIPLAEDGGWVLRAERLRDGRLALGTRRRDSDGAWTAGEMLLLDERAALALAAWLGAAVEASWLQTVRARQPETLETARDLYGDGMDSAERMAFELLRQLSPSLLTRSLLLLANAIGPEGRQRLIDRLNRTEDFSEDSMLRRQLAEEQEGFGYAVAAAALFDAIERGLAGPAADDESSAD